MIPHPGVPRPTTVVEHGSLLMGLSDEAARVPKCSAHPVMTPVGEETRCMQSKSTIELACVEGRCYVMGGGVHSPRCRVRTNLETPDHCGSPETGPEGVVQTIERDGVIGGETTSNDHVTPKSLDHVSPQISAFRAGPKAASQDALFFSSTLPNSLPLARFFRQNAKFSTCGGLAFPCPSAGPTTPTTTAGVQPPVTRDQKHQIFRRLRRALFSASPSAQGEKEERERRAFRSFTLVHPPPPPHSPSHGEGTQPPTAPAPQALRPHSGPCPSQAQPTTPTKSPTNGLAHSPSKAHHSHVHKSTQHKPCLPLIDENPIPRIAPPKVCARTVIPQARFQCKG